MYKLSPTNTGKIEFPYKIPFKIGCSLQEISTDGER